MSDHDAELRVKKTRVGTLITWSWTDGRRTISQKEHDVAERMTKKAEEEYNADELESDDVVARIWFDEDENVTKEEWVNK